jgi:hypothetical protein
VTGKSRTRTPKNGSYRSQGERIELQRHPRGSPKSAKELAIATTEQISEEGQRLGTAYKLKSGEVVNVPEPASK